MGPILAGTRFWKEPVGDAPLNHCGIVVVRRKYAFGVLRVRVSNHVKQRVRLCFAIYDEISTKDLVAAVFTVGLGEHHQLDIGRVAVKLAECGQ